MHIYRYHSVILLLLVLSCFFPQAGKANCASYSDEQFEDMLRALEGVYGAVPGPDLNGLNFTDHGYNFTDSACAPADPCGLAYNAYLLEQDRFNQTKFCEANQLGASSFGRGPFRGTNKPAPLDFTAELGKVFIENWACDATLDKNFPTHPYSCADNGHDVNSFWVELRLDADRSKKCRDRQWVRHESTRRTSELNLQIGATPDSDSCGGLKVNILRLPEFNRRLQDGDKFFHLLSGTSYRAQREGDKLCVYAYVAGVSPFFIDCKYTPEPTPASIVSPPASCWVSGACTGPSLSKWVLPITSRVAQCMHETVGMLFFDSADVCVGPSIFEQAQNNIKNTVMITLTLYIIFIGVKMSFGRFGGSNALIESLIKVALVMYFAVGAGWNDYFMGLLGASSELAVSFLNAATTSNTAPLASVGGSYDYCDFSGLDYGGASYLMLWDTLDCKFFYLMGFFQVSSSPVPIPRLLMNAVIAFFHLKFVLFFLLFFLALIIIGLMIYLIKSYVSTVIAVTILVYVSPIFIPLVLFDRTKTFFNNWKDELVGYLLYPVILFAFVGLFLAMIDSFYWGNAEFKQETVVVGGEMHPVGKLEYFECDTTPSATVDRLNLPGDAPATPGYTIPGDYSIGCFVYEPRGPITEKTISKLFKLNVDTGLFSKTRIITVIKLILFLVLFVHFINNLDQFVSTLVGTQRTSSAIQSKNYAAQGAMMAPNAAWQATKTGVQQLFRGARASIGTGRVGAATRGGGAGFSRSKR